MLRLSYLGIDGGEKNSGAGMTDVIVLYSYRYNVKHTNLYFIYRAYTLGLCTGCYKYGVLAVCIYGKQLLWYAHIITYVYVDNVIFEANTGDLFKVIIS